ncbi:MAG TPA: hypothetical protein VHG11_02000 [Pseudorhizobium sp.]|nr:hypothetical protein [Pseudorhizobium sp.]
MSGADQTLVHTLISEEVRRLVAESIEDGGCLPTARCAARIARAYPNAGLSPAEIADRIIEAAVHARISVEICRPALHSGAAS